MFEEIDLILSTKTIDEINEFKQQFNNKYDPIIKKHKYQKEEQRLQKLYTEKANELNSDELLKLSQNIKIIKCKYQDIIEHNIKSHVLEYCIGDLITINQTYERTDRHAFSSITVNNISLFDQFNSIRNINYHGLEHIYNKLKFNEVSFDQFVDFVSFDNYKMNLNLFKKLNDK